jgi:hypothetical protein
MAYATITEKVVGSTNTSERKILADDVNQIRQVIQTGEKDLKTKNISLLGNTITADNGSNWIRRNNNTFQFYNGSSWQEPSTATLLTFTAGEDIAARDVVYLKVSDGKIYKASTANNDWIGVATAAITSGASGTIYPNGSLVGGFSGLTSGTWYKVNSTAGTIDASDLTITNTLYNVGVAISATQIILIKNQLNGITNEINKNSIALRDLLLFNTALNMLNNATGTYASFLDIFSSNTGVNSTVDTGNTTSDYDTTNGVYLNKNVFFDATEYNTPSDTYVLYLDKNYSDVIISDVSFYAESYWTTDPTVTATVKVVFTYTDTTIEEIEIITIGAYTKYTAINPFPNKTISNLKIYSKRNQPKGHNRVKNISYIHGPITQKEIHLNYDKANPTNIYCSLFSDETTSNNIGDCEIEFYTDTTLLGTYDPHTLYIGLSFATTPNKVIIKQKNTELSEINRFVLFIS